MARTKAKPKEELALVIRSLTLTHDADETLQRLSQDATDYLGRKVSGSAIVRALLLWTRQQSATWLTAHISPFIEAEMSTGVVWGKKRGPA
jgi:hypothetical protein